jgi:hypothetical protein
MMPYMLTEAILGRQFLRLADGQWPRFGLFMLDLTIRLKVERSTTSDVQISIIIIPILKVPTALEFRAKTNWPFL